MIFVLVYVFIEVDVRLEVRSLMVKKVVMMGLSFVVRVVCVFFRELVLLILVRLVVVSSRILRLMDLVIIIVIEIFQWVVVSRWWMCDVLVCMVLLFVWVVVVLKWLWVRDEWVQMVWGMMVVLRIDVVRRIELVFLKCGMRLLSILVGLGGVMNSFVRKLIVMIIMSVMMMNLNGCVLWWFWMVSRIIDIVFVIRLFRSSGILNSRFSVIVLLIILVRLVVIVISLVCS